MIEAVLKYAFLQRALAAGLFIALACAVLGVFLLLRKDAMIGHGLSHVAFAGVAVGLLAGWMPLLAALVVSVAASLGIMKLKETAGLHGDTAIAIFSSVGLALGVTLASVSGRFNVALFGYLFGDVLAIEPAEVLLSIALAVVVVGLVAFHYHRFLFMTFDREAARSFRGAVLGASIVSALSVTAGLLAAYALDWPASGTIVLTAFLFFAVLYLRRLREGR